VTAGSSDSDWVRILTAAGMAEAQALALTALLRQSRDTELSALASKSDIAETRVDLLHDIVDVRTNLVQTKLDLMRGLAETKADILKWVIGAVGVVAVINAATVIGGVLALGRILAR
jgi:hypothetical protein